MSLVKNCIVLSLAYSVALLPASCGQRTSQSSSTSAAAADDFVSQQISAASKKSPSELKAAVMDIQGHLVEKLSSAKIKLVKEDGSAVDQVKDIDSDASGDMSKYYYVIAESKINNAFAMKMKADVESFAKNNSGKVTFSSFAIDANTGAVLTSKPLVPTKSMNLSFVGDYEKNMLEFQRSAKDYVAQLAGVVKKDSSDMGQNGLLFKSILNTFFPTAYAAPELDPNLIFFTQVIIGVALAATGVALIFPAVNKKSKGFGWAAAGCLISGILILDGAFPSSRKATDEQNKAKRN